MTYVLSWYDDKKLDAGQNNREFEVESDYRQESEGNGNESELYSFYWNGGGGYAEWSVEGTQGLSADGHSLLRRDLARQTVSHGRGR